MLNKDLERFYTHTMPITEVGCLIWVGASGGHKCEYGQFFIDGKKPDWLDDSSFVRVLFEDDDILNLEVCEVNWIKAVRFQVMAKL